MQEVPLSRYWTFVGNVNDFQALNHWNFQSKYLISCCSNNSESSLADIGHSSADAGTIYSIFVRKWMTTHDQIRVFIYLFNDFAHFFCRVLLLYNIFYSTLYEHIRFSLNIIYSIINLCHITYLHCWCFCVLTGIEPRPFILRCQNFTLGYRVLARVEFWRVLDDNSD